MTNTVAIAGQSNTIDLPAGRFSYRSWGAEQSELPSLLLLHGITSSSMGWGRVASALMGSYRVYAPDLRGHGDSPKPPAGSYSLRETADDVVAFIEALELEQPVLLGHSWGGATALFLASGAEATRPAPHFSKIILEDPACYFGDGDALVRARPYTRDIGLPLDELEKMQRANNPEWSEIDIQGKLDAMSKVSAEAVVSVFEQAKGYFFPLLAQLPAPTLLLRADPACGTVLPGEAWDLVLKYLPAHSVAVQIDGATHNIHRNRFEAFMHEVNTFLRG